MVTTINGSPSPTGPSSTAPSSPVPSSAPVSAGAIGGGFVPTTLFDLSMPVADAGAFGLRAPLNPEDASALLLLAEASLDKTTAKAHAASLETRFGAAGGALASVGQILGASQATLKAAQDALATAQTTLKTDTDKQAALKTRSDDAGHTVADLQEQIDAAKSAGTDTSQLSIQLSAAQKDEADVNTLLDAADEVVATDTKAVTGDTAAVQKAQTDLDSQSRNAAAALSQIATGLRFDIGRDAGQAVQKSARRDIAYDDVADTAKRFRDGDVARSRHDGDVDPKFRDGAAQHESRGAELAAHLATALSHAVPVLQNFAAAPPPAVSQTAALEANGRVRLSL